MAARITAYIVAAIVSVTFIAGLIVGAQRDENGPVDLIVLNGLVYTADEDGSFAEAVAIQGNRILRVGTTRDISRLRRAQTVVVDAKGGTVLPGFNDAHAHLRDGGLSLSAIDLTQLTTVDAVEREIAMWAKLHPDAPWIVGRGWHYELFPGGLPTRQMLDRIAGHRPAFLTSYDGHTAWVNSAALAAAGITRHTSDPAHGVVARETRSGEPTGVLKEEAMALVTRHMPKPDRAAELAALKSSIREAHRLGITSVQNAGGSIADLDLYKELERRGELDVRIYEALSVDAPLSAPELDRLDVVARDFPDDPLLKTGAVKIVVDGVVESRTAALLAPYSGQIDTTGAAGTARFDQRTLNALVTELDRRGWQVQLHTIGDRAVRMALNAIEQASKINPAPERGRRHRLEHIETIDKADIARVGALGVVASMQPFHALPTPGEPSLWTDNLGPERAARGWLFRSLSDGGARLVFGSDWPVASFDPRLGLHVAVNRTTLAGRPAGGSVPAERLSVAEAVDAYTRQAAWASFDDHRKGVIAPDMLADLVILSKDIFTLPAAELTSADVEVTIFDGHVVYDRSSFLTRRIVPGTRRTATTSAN
jgi:predicted amidohydrolase YtcJ